MVKSQISHAQMDEDKRLKKASKIIAVLERFVNLSRCNLLEIGTGSGFISTSLSEHCNSVVSVDIYDERISKEGYDYIKVKDENLPFEKEKFDIVITNQVVEHVPDQKLHLSEVYRVLKKEGIAYLATPNKYWISDPHHHLPFISWFSRENSEKYLQFIKNKKWDIYPLSYNEIKLLSKEFSRFYNITPNLIRYPKRYNLDMYPFIQSFVRVMPLRLLELFNFILPSYVVVLRK